MENNVETEACQGLDFVNTLHIFSVEEASLGLRLTDMNAAKWGLNILHLTWQKLG